MTALTEAEAVVIRLVDEGRDDAGTCRFCAVPASTLHEDACIVNAAVEVIYPRWKEDRAAMVEADATIAERGRLWKAVADYRPDEPAWYIEHRDAVLDIIAAEYPAQRRHRARPR